MLEVYFGGDTIGVREKAYKKIASLEKKGVSCERVTAENWSPGAVTDAAGSTSLFGTKEAYIFDTPSESKEFFEYIFDNLDVLADSENTFILIEGALLAPQKKKIGKHATVSEEVAGKKRERFNTFQFADAYTRKDKKTLWLLLAHALREGIALEEIIGTIFWQVKLLQLASKTSSAKEAGQKDFSYKKAKRALSNFKEGEVQRHSRTLVSIYHDGHLGKRDLNIALERWVLEL